MAWRRSASQWNSGPQGLGAKFKVGIVAGLVGTLGFYGLQALTTPQRPTQLDSVANGKLVIPETVETVQPETKSPPFPSQFTYGGESYSLLGVGVRSVSFLSFHVYAVGLYIADSDKGKVKAILGANASMEDLLDAEKGAELVSKLLNGGVRLDIRIVPVRNTDFGHMRDGLVRTTMANPRFKAEGNNEEFGEGLAQLKRAFGRKMTVAKHQILHLNRDRDGTLRIEYFKGNPETSVQEGMAMGAVTVPLVSELLFLQYLSGSKPSSESLRKDAVKGLAQLTL